ncbi:MAG: restriction endonuclease subunit S [Candidatus Firestonebacteria bacterium]
MKGFKETEIGLIPEEWELVKLGDKKKFAILSSGIDNFSKEKDYLSTSSIEYNKIGNIECKITFKNRPLRANMQPKMDSVWFAKMKNTLKVYSFTKENISEINRYILSTGFTGVVCSGKVNPIFLKQIFLSDYFGKFKDSLAHGSTQKAVNNSDIQNINIPLPPIFEQSNISYILSKIQSAIETQEKIIKTTTELKKAMMQKLFAEGLYDEPQRNTEIGKIPKSWKVVKIKDAIRETFTKNPEKELSKSIKYVDVSSVSNEIFSIIGHQVFLGKDAPGRARKIIYSNDVIFATVRPTLKRVAKVGSEYNNEYCSTAFCVLRADESRLDYEFLYQYLITDSFIKEIGKLQTGASYPAVRDDNVREMKIPFPAIKGQKEISSILKQLDEKVLITIKRKDCLQSLFKSMLHQLMTGRIRVKDLKIA